MADVVDVGSGDEEMKSTMLRVFEELLRLERATVIRFPKGAMPSMIKTNQCKILFLTKEKEPTSDDHLENSESSADDQPSRRGGRD